ncbi:hypothetical protein Btru_048421 [Bulinus truncatus]|nr:hypothetical protein Btru_048421 [Bulinus truncatus]
MTCVDMCKPFTSAFPAYPKTSYTGHLTPSQGLPKMQEPLDLGPSQSTPLSLSSLPYPASLPLSSSSSSRTSVIVPPSSPPAPPSSLVKEESRKDIEPKVAHYLGVNCVLFTYFSGDTSTVVDDHFTRALNQTTGYDTANNTARDKTHVNKDIMDEQRQLLVAGGEVLPDSQKTSLLNNAHSQIDTMEILLDSQRTSLLNNAHSQIDILGVSHISRVKGHFLLLYEKLNYKHSQTHPRPMTARNLPPSFWNSSYQSQVSQQHFLGQSSHQYHSPSSSGVSGSAASDLNPFHPTHPYLSPALHSLSNLPADPWTYSFPSASTSMSYPHRPVPYDLSYSTSSRFGQSYSSFLMQPSAVRSTHFGAMSGHCDVTKPAEHSRPRYSDHRFGPDYVTHHGSCTALDAGTGLQEATKDLYWF